MKWNSSVVLGAVLIAQHGIQVVEGQTWFFSRMLRGGNDLVASTEDTGSMLDKGTGKKVQRSLDAAGNAEVLTGQVCMQQAAGFNLQCTAGDVRLASATNIVIQDDGCAFAGDTVTFTADFEVVLTAQARYDIGIWFSEDGDPNGDASLTGTCTAVTPAYGPDPPFVDLDGIVSGTQDTCGDIDDAHNPLMQKITLTVTCISNGANPPKLRLPYCTSWRQSGDNSLCTSPLQAVPGAPSKCKCDDTFTVDIDVPQCDPASCADQCNDGKCQPNGDCVKVPKAVSTPCQDGNYCTSFGGKPGDADHCDGAGKCVGIPVNCGPGDQCNDKECDEVADACVAVPKAASTPCQDGLYCTSETGVPGIPDHCDGAGKCVGIPVNCGPGDQCNDKKCDEVADACVTVPKAASTPCQDGLYCTSETGVPGNSDHCDGAGKCVGIPVVCNDNNVCTTDSCDENGDKCAFNPKPSGTSCGPAKPEVCDAADTCDGNGICVDNKRTNGYYLKCGTDLYLCQILQDEITKVGNSYNIGGCNTGRVTKVNILPATCLTDGIPLPPGKCPNGKDLSNYGYATCTAPAGWTGCVSKFP